LIESGLGDGDVVQRVLGGETELFRVLVERYRHEFGRYAISLVGDEDSAQDAMQEAFIRAFDSLGSCRDPQRFKAWFFRILTNQCHNVRSRRRREVSLDGFDAPARDRTDADVEQDELRRAIDAALGDLTPEQREAFVMKHVDGRSYEEIAELLHTGVDALKMRVYRARDSLRRRLEDTP
jgi:RNA polymerase sigma-70 factor (ECF subfamily)